MRQEFEVSEPVWVKTGRHVIHAPPFLRFLNRTRRPEWEEGPIRGWRECAAMYLVRINRTGEDAVVYPANLRRRSAAAAGDVFPGTRP